MDAIRSNQSVGRMGSSAEFNDQEMLWNDQNQDRVVGRAGGKC